MVLLSPQTNVPCPAGVETSTAPALLADSLQAEALWQVRDRTVAKCRWNRDILELNGWTITPHRFLKVIPPPDRAFDEGRCCLDGLLWPRRHECRLLAAIRSASDPTGEDETGEAQHQNNRESETVVAALEAFHGHLSGPILDQVYHWPSVKGILPLYQVLERFPRFLLLWDAHPQLAWLVAQKLFAEGLMDAGSHSQVIYLLGKGPLELARWLGLPRRRSALRCLRRCPLDNLEVLWSNLPILGIILSSEPLLEFSAHAAPAFMPSLLQIVKSGPAPNRVILEYLHDAFLSGGWLWTEASERLREWQKRPEGPTGHPLRAIHSVRRFWDETWETTGESHLNFAATLPPPPFGGAESAIGQIRPLRTVGELVRFSRALRNCVEEAYVSIAFAGVVAFYRVDIAGDLPSMLSLQRSDHSWNYWQCLGKNNMQPSPATSRVVSEWLQKHGILPF